MIRVAGLIDKNTETPQSFEEGMRAAEESAGIPSDAELYGEEWATPEPDETGRVPSMSRPKDEATGEVVETEEVVEAPEAETTPVEAEPVVEPPAPDAQVLAELAELKAKMGTLINENAELRKAYAEPAIDPSWYEQALETDPAQAVGLAIQSGNPHQYEQSLRAWYDVDPVAAGRFERQVEMAQLQESISQRLAPQLAGANTVAQKAEMEQAILAVKGKHDDFEMVMGSWDEAAANRLVESGFPVRVLEGFNGDLAEKQAALETLFRWHKAEQAGTIAAAAEEIKVETAEAAKERKRKAQVASATTTTPDAVEESEAERMERVWKEQRPSMRDAWTGRPGQ